MRIGNRLFPYPVLNREHIANHFINSSFRLDLTIHKEQGYFILKDICYVTNNENLLRLVYENKVSVLCIVECSQTVYRQSFEISDVPQTIRIPIFDLKDNVVISSYAYAKENINNYYDGDFLEEYQGVSFDIEKYDILASDDGFTDKVVYEENQDAKVSSIFLVVKDLDSNSKAMKVEMKSNKIILTLPPDQFTMYDRMKLISHFQNVYFSIMLVPALAQIFESLKKDSIEEIRYEYDWFLSIEKAYEKVFGFALSQSDFQSADSLILAQELLGSPSTKAIETIYRFAVKNGGGYDAEE